MIRKIVIDQLRPGMYVVDLHKPWLEHGLWLSRFPVRDWVQIRRLIDAGFTEISIDTRRGRDVDLPGSSPPLPVPPEPRPLRRPPPTVSLGEERRRASRLLGDACRQLDEMARAARAGERVDALALEVVVDKLIESVARNPDALVPLARIKRPETYDAGHAVEIGRAHV